MESSRTKVLVVLEACLGGTRRHVVDLISGLGDRCEVTLVYSMHRADTGWAAFIEDLEREGRVRLICVNSMRRNLHPMHDLIAALRLLRVALSERYDVVHLHSGKAGLLGRLILPWYRRRTVYTPNASPALLNPVFATIERLLSRSLNAAVICVSPSEKDELMSLGIVKSSNAVVINSGVNIPSLASVVQPSAARYDVIGVGRITAQKNWQNFVRAIAALKESYPTLQVVWVGDGEERAEMESLISGLGLSNTLQVVGWVNDVTPYYRQTRCLFLSSSYESFGYVTAEAMSYGIPVCGTNTAGTRDLIVDGETGFLVSLDNSQAAAEALGRLLADSVLWNQMSRAARERVIKHFEVGTMCDQVYNLYRYLSRKGADFEAQSFGDHNIVQLESAD
ncbi:glycosyltransferase family 4 protein [Deinococcus pimensis]|uniref:glycosyltransferase family 4 protein n=1 Tax=Deinococcus pimensis TaxID=309888 RepID=UPI000A07AB19|nr:glycosyltransferase family 4 protein [Deinococcus pimensis]